MKKDSAQGGGPSGGPGRYLVLQVLVLPLQLLDLDGEVLPLRQQPGDLLLQIWEQRWERGVGKGP